MIKFHDVAKAAAMGAIAVLVSASFAAAQQGGKYWTPADGQPVVHRASPARHHIAKRTTRTPTRSALARMDDPAATKKKEHHLILQVNTNDPAAMNLALNNATNVAQYYKDSGERVKIEVVTFGPGLNMLREDTSPVKARIEEMALSTPEVSFKACGNTQEKMQKAENKNIPIVRQAEVVKSGVVRVMELQEMGWTYVKP
ncbi:MULTISPECIES: DsrE family protein [unclassified Bradyrhizobium]|uniref:DsrE family protein n=1 Tax=unclassified Bradyrhizobium TaxID=2631580 RepID=UPI00041755AF|nr:MULTISPECIES: DsrE family protein [unclassified Bradyrhizobium]MCP3459296.1 DsrE family protein [Bradyrhizobium sp. CCGUVB23]